MSEVTAEEAERTGKLQTVWERIPTRRELGNFFAPGVEYLWCLLRNEAHAERVEGWQRIQMRSPGNPAGRPLSRFQIAGHDVVLLAQGDPIPGASPDACGIPVRIDPELEGLLGLAQVAPAPPQPTPPKKATLPTESSRAAGPGR